MRLLSCRAFGLFCSCALLFVCSLVRSCVCLFCTLDLLVRLSNLLDVCVRLFVFVLFGFSSFVFCIVCLVVVPTRPDLATKT